VLAHDMPLLMHGSGDVQPSKVHPESIRILSELTADYIANLVQAAMDAHEILNDGPQWLPPPPLPRDRAPPIPSPPNLTNDHTNNNRATFTSSSGNGGGGGGSGKQPGSNDPQQQQTTQKRQQKRPRTEDEFWDEPLPEPKIKGMSNSSNHPANRNGAAVAAANVPKFEGVPIDEWVGVTGVNFWETSRARKAHVAAPSAITTPSFIFPICHDVGLYGKVLDVQLARRAIFAPLMVDKILMEMVQTEGAALRRHRNKRRGDSNHGGGDGDDDNEDPDETDLERKDGATWPGLEYLLPVHVMKDIFGDEGGSSE
jgi:hypothetical protein